MNGSQGARRRVVFGLVGSNLDAGSGSERWERWRPSVALCSQEDWLVDRFVLLYGKRDAALAELLVADIARIAPETTVERRLFEVQDPWDFEEVYGALYDLAAATRFDEDAEEYLLHITTGTHVFQICLFLLAESRHFPARLLQLAPPVRRGRDAAGPGRVTVIDLDLSCYDRIARRFHREQEEGHRFLKAGIDTRDEAFNRLVDRIETVALRSTDPILLTGPTGAGKSRLARRIYELKRQRRQLAGPFVEVNCATLRGDMAMSTLFGHRRGAFTGAVGERAGLLVQADGGLLFLDEIGELGADEQAMLLRALEEGRFLPLGADREVESRFQLLAGTHRDLRREAQGGRFRPDLLARIDLWTFRLPGLAERRADIEPNLRYELGELTARTGQAISFNREAWDRYLDFALSPRASFRGNFRDLNGSVRRMATLAPGGRITVGVVEEELARLAAAWGAADEAGPRSAGEARIVSLLGQDGWDGLDLFDRVQLVAVVEVCLASRSLAEAGRRLFAASRARKTSRNDADRLRKYLGRFGLSFAAIQAGAPP